MLFLKEPLVCLYSPAVDMFLFALFIKTVHTVLFFLILQIEFVSFMHNILEFVYYHAV